MVKARLTGGGIGPVSLQWEYIEANRDVVRRVVTAMEDKAVLYEPSLVRNVRPRRSYAAGLPLMRCRSFHRTRRTSPRYFPYG